MKRKVSATVIAAVLGFSAANTAMATGTIHYKGNIVESVCEINVNGAGESATVSLGQYSLGELETGSDMPGTDFYIKVSGCPESAVDHVNITFAGTKWQDESNSFVVSDLGGGLGIKVKNAVDGSATTAVVPNVNYPLAVVAETEKQFDYKANLYVVNDTTLKSGDFSTTVTLNVALD